MYLGRLHIIALDWFPDWDNGGPKLLVSRPGAHVTARIANLPQLFLMTEH